jgi:ABC transport system ATP-binding/permease protein
MNVVSLEGVRKQHAEKLVLDGVTIGVADDERVGVIGTNGSGKSTLLKIIAGLMEPDDGRVVLGNHVRVHYLPQDPDLDPTDSAIGAVLGGDSEAAHIARSFERAAAAVRADGTDAGAQAALERATAAMDSHAGWDLEHRARALLDKLGVADVDDPIAGRSGGQRKRIALAAALVEPVELLILDEPTNHLDVEIVEWLEQTLRSWSKALLLVTHDRYLLDRVANRVIEVHAGGLHSHAGSYADYLEARELREEQAAAADRKRANQARTELEWLRRGPKARTSKAKYRVERAKELVGTDRYTEPDELEIALPSRRLGGKVVNLHNAGKSYGDHTVLRDVDHKLAPDDRVGVVGPNGSGKSTLLNLIAGRIEPDEGSVRTGETVHVGYYGQDPTPIAPRTRVIDAVLEVVRETQLTSGLKVTAGQLLERFLFDDEAQKAYVEELSGGERRRLELLLVLADAPNLLILDEPTNDLDLDTLAVLESYLDSWEGCLVVASHDRFFLDRVCDSLFGIEPDGTVRHHPGGWSAYRERRAGQLAARKQARARAEAGAPAGRGTPGGAPAGTGTPDGAPGDEDAHGGTPGRPPTAARKRTYNEQRELRSLEARIAKLEARKAELTAAVQAAGEDYQEAARLGTALAEADAELETAESRWLELSMIGEDG